MRRLRGWGWGRLIGRLEQLDLREGGPAVEALAVGAGLGLHELVGRDLAARGACGGVVEEAEAGVVGVGAEDWGGWVWGVGSCCGSPGFGPGLGLMRLGWDSIRKAVCHPPPPPHIHTPPEGLVGGLAERKESLSQGCMRRESTSEAAPEAVG